MATVLIVDDLSANRALLLALLHNQGHRLLEARDGAEGLAAVHAEHPDLVITDVLMPVMDGYELVRQLQLDPATSRIPVVFHTAHYGEREARALALSRGVSYVLTKPVKSEEVLKVVGRALSGMSDAAAPTAVVPLLEFDREHLRLLTDKLSEKTSDLRIANARLRAIINIGLQLASRRDSEHLLDDACAAVHDLFGATYVTLGLIDLNDGTVQRCVACGGDCADWITLGAPVPGVLEKVVAERRTLRGDNTGGDPAQLELHPLHPEVQAYLAAPIASPAVVFGWICLIGNEGRSFSQDDEDLLLALAGQIGRIYALEHEILERKQAESDLRHERDRAQHYLDTADVILLALDTEARITLANRYACAILGWTAEELLGRDWIDTCLPARIRPDLRKRFKELRGGKAFILDHPILTKSGEERLIEWRNTALRDDAGQVVGTFSSGLDITERQRAEAEIRQSQSREAAILESVLDCIVTMDADGKVIEFNAAAERTFGYTKGEAIGRLLADLIIPPPLRTAHAAGLARYLTTGEGALLGKLIEITAVRSDGSELPVELAITAILPDSAPVFTGVLRDISARKQADENRARLAAIVDSSDDAIFSTTLDDTILTWNAGAERLYGYTAAEMIGRNRAMVAPLGKSAELTGAILRRAARGEAGDSLETQHIRKDGAIIDISLMISPMTDPVGRVIGASTIARDITRWKKAEADVVETEERMRFALEAAGVGIWDMDFKTGINRWSKTLEAQYGLAPGTFGGSFETFIERIHPDDRQAVMETIRRAAKTGADYTLLNRTIWPDGSVRWLTAVGRVYLSEGGEPLRGLGISMDVTERRSLEAQYQQAQKMEAIGRLAGGVAHDFNNLLTAILGYCELLLADLDPGDPRQADITEIQKAGISAAALTRQLLAFSRKEIIEPTLLDLNLLVNDMRAMLGRLIGEDVKVVLKLRATPALVLADHGQMEQIVMNLAVNARDAMPKGGTLTIEIGEVELDENYPKTHFSVEPGPYIALTVSDTGTGMTPQVQARLFEPFFTTKEPGKGTGLGLATVHGIATRSGGTVNVYSEVGKGSSIKVYFPKSGAGELLVEAPPQVARPHIGAWTVLLVEDAEGLRELTRRLLERQGYRVLVAGNADEAMRLFEQDGRVDVVLTDVVMPGASGPELTKQLLEQSPGLKVVFMSGYTEEAIVQHGVLNPGVAFLHKPFTSESLGRKLRDVLDRETIESPLLKV